MYQKLIGECENILKRENGITKDLLILKLDIKFNNSLKTNVQYEVYDPDSKIRLNLNKCYGTQIIISIPVKLDNGTIILYQDMYDYGYNLFNELDPFYNNICTLYKTKDGTDMILSDRQEIYYNNQKNNFCQKNCSLVSYNINTKMENCNCKIQNEGIIKTDLSNIEKVEEENEVNEVLDQFFTTLENSNFLVMECYKLVFGEKGFKDNIGSIIMIISFFLLLALFLTFIFYSKNKIKVYIFEIVDNIMKNPKTNRNNNSKRDKIKNSEIQKKLKDSPKQHDLKLGKKCNTIIIKKKNNKESAKLIEKRKKAPPKKSNKKITPLMQKQKIPAINKNRKKPLNVLIQINNSNNYNLNSLSPALDSSAGKNKLMKSNANNNNQGIFLFN